MLADEDVLSAVKARNLGSRIFTNDELVAEVARRELGQRMLEASPGAASQVRALAAAAAQQVELHKENERLKAALAEEAVQLQAALASSSGAAEDQGSAGGASEAADGGVECQARRYIIIPVYKHIHVYMYMHMHIYIYTYVHT